MGKSLEVVQAVYDAYKRKDEEAFLEVFDAEAEIYQTELLPWGGRFRGIEGVKEFIGKLVTHIDSVVEPEELIEAGERIVEIGRSRGRVNATGVEFDVREVHLWEVRRGRIVSFQSYIDTPAMLDILNVG